MSVFDQYAEMMQRFLIARGDNDGTIYAENVRAFFDIGFAQSALVLGEGLKRGMIVQRIGLLCPNDSRMLCDGSATELANWPIAINCDACESLEIEPFAFAPKDCKKMLFYRVAP